MNLLPYLLHSVEEYIEEILLYHFVDCTRFLSGTTVLNPLIRFFNVPDFNFWWCCFTLPLASEVVVVRISSYSMSALRRSSTFTTFATKFAATCSANLHTIRFPYVCNNLFHLGHAVHKQPHLVQHYQILAHTLLVTRQYISLICPQPLEQMVCQSSPNHLVQPLPSYNYHFHNLTHQICTGTALCQQRQHRITCAPRILCAFAYTFVMPLRCTWSARPRLASDKPSLLPLRAAPCHSH